MEPGCSGLHLLQAALLYDTTPIHCTPLPLHPPVMNTQQLPRFARAARCGLTCALRYLYLSLSLYMYMYIYIYIYIYLGSSGICLCLSKCATPSPPIKSLDFRGFDSSKFLILRYIYTYIQAMSANPSNPVFNHNLFEAVCMIYVYIYIYTYVYVYIYMYIYYIHICVYIYIYTYIHVYVYICIYLYLSLPIYIYIYIHTQSIQ